jgi:hypothetical protein
MKEPLYVGAAQQESDTVSQVMRSCHQDLQSFTEDYSLFFVNTMHMYLRISVSLFDLYARQFDTRLDVVHFELPQPLLEEDVKHPAGVKPPEPGWSRCVQGLPHDQWKGFRAWMESSRWLASDGKDGKVLYGCTAEEVQVRDPVKLQRMQVVGIREFVPITFFLPHNQASRLYVNTKNGPPFSCVYVQKNSPGEGEAIELFKALRQS